ncbi:TRAP transporter substrate-binding protein [bacterium]|nr:TRAP transporter substrate-binding protein [bacterium]
MKRRAFLSQAVGLAAATPLLPSNTISAKAPRFQWRLALGVPRTFPIWGTGISRFAEQVSRLTGGELQIRVFGAGELLPALESFAAIRAHRIEMGHSAAYYWQGKIPASPFFTAVPFGGDAIENLTWLSEGGGQELYDRMLKPFGVKALPCGAVPEQMMGWFRKPISDVSDLVGLKIRIPGLASRVYRAVGAVPTLVPGGEVFTSLATGVIDAAEWIGPYHDYTIGLHRAASYYYGPGWQEQGALLELLISEKAWQSLPQDFQQVLSITARETTLWMLQKFRAKNGEYLERLTREDDVTILRAPESVLNRLSEVSDEVSTKLARRDPFIREIRDSYTKFQRAQQTLNSLTSLGRYGA